MRGSVTPTPLWLLRLRARAPRIAVIAAGFVLALVGAKSLFATTPTSQAPQRSGRPAPDLAAHAVAEDFARAFLTAGTGDDPPAPWSETHHPGEVWTAVVADREDGRGRHLVTVAARVGKVLSYVAVPVARDRKRRLVIAAAPAIVGPPATDRAGASEPEREVDESAIREVASRVIRNYLARERQDLRADLVHGAAITLPTERHRVTSIDAITWAVERRRVAVALTARTPRGRELALRYELDVVLRAGRWLVRTVHVNPLSSQEARP